MAVAGALTEGPGAGTKPSAQHGPGPVREGSCVLVTMLKSAGVTPKVKGLKHERGTSRKGMQLPQGLSALNRRRSSIRENGFGEAVLEHSGSSEQQRLLGTAMVFILR